MFGLLAGFSAAAVEREETMNRSAREVFSDHLKLRAESNLKEDLDRNYSDGEQIRGGRYEYLAQHVEGELASRRNATCQGVTQPIKRGITPRPPHQLPPDRE